MNKFRNFIECLILLLVLVSCSQSGSSEIDLNGNESNLPEELKGIKIYSVSTGNMGYVKVAILDNKINSITYPVGKISQSTVIVNKQNNKLVQVSEILVENDSIIVCRK